MEPPSTRMEAPVMLAARVYGNTLGGHTGAGGDYGHRSQRENVADKADDAPGEDNAADDGLSPVRRRLLHCASCGVVPLFLKAEFFLLQGVSDGTVIHQHGDQQRDAALGQVKEVQWACSRRSGSRCPGPQSVG